MTLNVNLDIKANVPGAEQYIFLSEAGVNEICFFNNILI